jgi:hypothetical protein
LQIFQNGDAYLVEFDNPGFIFIRNNKLIQIPYLERLIENKMIREYRFTVQINDCFILMSDGVIHAGVGKILNFGWTWNSVASYALEITNNTLSASRLAAYLSQACDDLYMQIPGDDTTVAVARIINTKEINLFTGPPFSKEDDTRLIQDFTSGTAKKIISGGTSANIAARILNKNIITNHNYTDPALPPVARIEGIDLVTEGVLTLSRALILLKQFTHGNVDESFFDELDKDNGGSRIAKLIIEDCTILNLFVGKAINEAHQNTELPFDLSIRMNLVEQIKDAVVKMGKKVTVKYY